MKMWKLSHTDVCDCDEIQTVSHRITCVDAPNCKWTELAVPTLAVVNCANNWDESIYVKYRGRDLGHGPDKISVPPKVAKLQWYKFICYTNIS